MSDLTLPIIAFFVMAVLFAIGANYIFTDKKK